MNYYLLLSSVSFYQRNLFSPRDISNKASKKSRSCWTPPSSWIPGSQTIGPHFMQENMCLAFFNIRLRAQNSKVVSTKLVFNQGMTVLPDVQQRLVVFQKHSFQRWNIILIMLYKRRYVVLLQSQSIYAVIQ